MPAPFELVNGPVTIYYAAVGTAAPNVAVDPDGSWSTLGTNGDKNYGDDGVTLTPSRDYAYQMVLGSTAPQKAFLQEQGYTVNVPLVDMTAETMARIMNGAAVSDMAASSGEGGHRSFDLMISDDVSELAILIRGKSPYADDMSAQHWIPRCHVSDVGDYGYIKGEAATYDVEFTALEHSTHGFGKYYAQDEAAA